VSLGGAFVVPEGMASLVRRAKPSSWATRPPAWVGVSWLILFRGS
jgi:hypothetical protein